MTEFVSAKKHLSRFTRPFPMGKTDFTQRRKVRKGRKVLAATTPYPSSFEEGSPKVPSLGNEGSGVVDFSTDPLFS
jgi:hypothetical protein